MNKNKTTNFTLLIPDLLKLCIESNDAINLEIIKKIKEKEKLMSYLENKAVSKYLDEIIKDNKIEEYN